MHQKEKTAASKSLGFCWLLAFRRTSESLNLAAVKLSYEVVIFLSITHVSRLSYLIDSSHVSRLKIRLAHYVFRLVFLIERLRMFVLPRLRFVLKRPISRRI